MNHRPVRPIVCPPQCVVRDYYTTREVPVIHPIININRQHIVNVPRHIYQPMTRNEVVDPGYMNNPPCGGRGPGRVSPSRGMEPGYMNPSRGGCHRCR